MTTLSDATTVRETTQVTTKAETSQSPILSDFTSSGSTDSMLSSIPSHVTTKSHSTSTTMQEETINCVFPGMRDMTENILTKLEDIPSITGSTTAKDPALLEELTKEVLQNITDDLNAPTECINSATSETLVDTLSNYDSIGGLLKMLVSHIPKDSELSITTDKIVVIAKSMSRNALLQGKPLSTNADRSPVVISTESIEHLPEGDYISMMVYFKTNSTLMQGLTSNHSINNTHESNGDHLTKVLSDEILTFDFLVDGKEHSVGLDFTLSTSGLHDPTMESVCAFWNPNLGIFSTKGLKKISESSGSVTCTSEHATSFAILLKVSDYEIPDAHKYVQTMLTQILSSVSIVALCLMIFLCTYFGSLRQKERYIINTNHAAALLAALSIFIMGVDRTENKIVCSVIAGVLHYLFLSVFGWTLVQGIDLYYKIVKVYGADKRRLHTYQFLGWGVPVSIVVITAGLRGDSYRSPESCWLNTKDGVIWAFVAPVGAVVLVNTVILIMIGRILYRSTNAMDAMNDMHGIRNSLKGTFILTPILGTTWIFGFFAQSNQQVLFQYLFVIFNCLQGVFMCAVYCVLNKEVQTVVRRAIAELKSSNPRITLNVNLNVVVPIEQSIDTSGATVPTITENIKVTSNVKVTEKTSPHTLYGDWGNGLLEVADPDRCTKGSKDTLVEDMEAVGLY